MTPRLLADAVLLLHGLFIVFVLAGGALVWRWPLAALLHLPAVAWAAWISWTGSDCPLTPLENTLRREAGDTGYEGGFVQHYLLGVIYPEAMTREWQVGVGVFVVLLNVGIYARLLLRWRRRGA
ncbi:MULTISPECIES: DUF2784 domain-containing protein [unclassified Variovorax]|uniref:DUF2784 domain-containing protein n=1 Tax=unclassified Variovorax TaxID=663243 RepID=UPI00076BD43E|nr:MULTISPECIES: DUF2784 domain-containing protein [unclassified Variovorax]KWT73977.1 hypothetical protein APY03_5828 [Variovorax sp. WDL1]PNG52313.1 hypothetical protein CHC07_04686 [Variovorax sp. B4]PNG54853.1 hypothetical protein CHC06_03652 [Variovorax sp. B2]VTV15864.1 hypothetical protein WDL1CHR_06226 [Variovorax sp. WDL1]